MQPPHASVLWPHMLTLGGKIPTMLDNWPFDVPREAQAIAQRGILERSDAIRCVFRDRKDGAWVALDRTDAASNGELTLTTLEKIVDADASIKELAYIERANAAIRESPDVAWQIVPVCDVLPAIRRDPGKPMPALLNYRLLSGLMHVLLAIAGALVLAWFAQSISRDRYGHTLNWAALATCFLIPVVGLTLFAAYISFRMFPTLDNLRHLSDFEEVLQRFRLEWWKTSTRPPVERWRNITLFWWATELVVYGFVVWGIASWIGHRQMSRLELSMPIVINVLGTIVALMIIALVVARAVWVTIRNMRWMLSWIAKGNS